MAPTKLLHRISTQVYGLTVIQVTVRTDAQERHDSEVNKLDSRPVRARLSFSLISVTQLTRMINYDSLFL